MLILFSLLQWLFHSVIGQEMLSNPRCNEQMRPGECTNFTVSWYYDRYAHRCREFFYSGCGGTMNRFSTKAECDSECHFEALEDKVEERCQQKYDIGTCEADIERWYFDWTLKRCVCSWWSGCGGNTNRFYSANHCMQICGQFSEHEPLFVQPDWIPPRPMYKDEAWAPKVTTQPIDPRSYLIGTQRTEYEQPRPVLPNPEETPRLADPRHDHGGYYEHSHQPIEQQNNQFQYQPDRRHEVHHEHLPQQPQPGNPQIFDENEIQVNVDYPQGPLPKVDPYFTGKFVNEPDFEQFDSDAVLKGHFQPPEEHDQLTVPEIERIPFSRRRDDLDGAFERTPYAPDYLDDINYRNAEPYPAALRIGNVGFATGPPVEIEADYEELRKVRKVREAKQDEETDLNESSIQTTVISTPQKKKRIKVLRRKPLIRGIVRASDLRNPKKSSKPKQIEIQEESTPSEKPETLLKIEENLVITPKTTEFVPISDQIPVRNSENPQFSVLLEPNSANFGQPATRYTYERNLYPVSASGWILHNTPPPMTTNLPYLVEKPIPPTPHHGLELRLPILPMPDPRYTVQTTQNAAIPSNFPPTWPSMRNQNPRLQNKLKEEEEDEDESIEIQIVRGDYLEPVNGKNINYDDYYTEMEYLKDEETDFQLKNMRLTTRIPFTEIPSQEMPTEAAAWTRDSRIFHAALPFYLVSTKTPLTVPLKLRMPEAFLTSTPRPVVRQELETNRVPERAEIPKTPVHYPRNEELGEMRSQQVTLTTRAPVLTTGTSFLPKTTQSRPVLPSERIPFTARAPRPPKNQVDQWGWIRTAQRRTGPPPQVNPIITRRTPQTTKTTVPTLPPTQRIIPTPQIIPKTDKSASLPVEEQGLSLLPPKV